MVTLLQPFFSRLPWATYLVAAVVLTLSLFVMACGDDDDDDDDGDDDTASEADADEILVGALLDFSGSWQTLGRASEATLNIAVEEINADLESEGRDERVRLIIEDTGLDPDTALEKLQELHDQGVQVVVGPQSSSEASALLDYAGENDILLISQGSTASSLSLADDNLFRFAPDDRQEAGALLPLLLDDGVQTVLPVCRNDQGNQGLCDSVSAGFEEAGGTSLPAIDYEGDADPATVVEQIQGALEGSDTSTTAIYLAAFEEVVDLFNEASAAGLDNVSWYGSSSLALSPVLIAEENAEAEEFAEAVNFPNPIFGLDPDHPSHSSRWQPLADEVAAEVDFEPDAFALSTYDIVNIAVEAYLAVGFDDFDAYKAEFVEIAASHDAVTDSTELNEAGDRLTAAFDFWALQPAAGGGHEWVKVAVFVPDGSGGGTITRLD
jgi:branched-chain amino acid transport system substrate-binding protein